MLATNWERYYPIVEPSTDPADEVSGIVFEISEDELGAAVAYEVAEYARAAVRLGSDVEAFVYLKAEFVAPTSPWDRVGALAVSRLRRASESATTNAEPASARFTAFPAQVM